MTRAFFIEGFPMPVTDQETVKYWQERGRRVGEIIDIEDGWKVETIKEISKGSDK